MVEDRRLNQIERVIGQKLFQNAARFSHQRGAFFNLCHQCSHHQQSGKEHEHSRIGGRFRGVDNIVDKSLKKRFADSGDVYLHLRSKPE